MFTPHFKKLNIFLSWKGKAIGLCPSGRNLTKRNWSWNLAIQDRILYLDDVAKPDRDTVIMHTSQLLAHAVLSSMKDDWWCFSSLYFKAPAVTYNKRYKNQPATLDAELSVGKQRTRGASLGLYDRTSPKRKNPEEGKGNVFEDFQENFQKSMSCGTSFSGWKW